MKITVQDVFNLVEGLNEINEKELPVSLAFKLQRNSLKINDEAKTAQEFEQKIIDKYKHKTTDEGQAFIKNEKLEAFNKEKDELMSQEIDVGLQQIEISDLNIDGLMIKPRVLMLLDKIIKEDENESQNQIQNDKEED